jgi:hypothetical protein
MLQQLLQKLQLVNLLAHAPAAAPKTATRPAAMLAHAPAAAPETATSPAAMLAHAPAAATETATIVQLLVRAPAADYLSSCKYCNYPSSCSSC